MSLVISFFPPFYFVNRLFFLSLVSLFVSPSNHKHSKNQITILFSFFDSFNLIYISSLSLFQLEMRHLCFWPNWVFDVNFQNKNNNNNKKININNTLNLDINLHHHNIYIYISFQITIIWNEIEREKEKLFFLIHQLRKKFFFFF